jgi:hypothetical protein
MLQQQQQNSDNVGGGGEDDEEGEQHEVNKRDVYMVENNIENKVENGAYVENNVNLSYEVYEDENDENINFNVDSDFKFENNIENDGGNIIEVNNGLARLSDGGLTSLSGLTSFFDVLKSLNRSKRSSPSTAGSVCAPVRSANP